MKASQGNPHDIPSGREIRIHITVPRRVSVTFFKQSMKMKPGNHPSFLIMHNPDTLGYLLLSLCH